MPLHASGQLEYAPKIDPEHAMHSPLVETVATLQLLACILHMNQLGSKRPIGNQVCSQGSRVGLAMPVFPICQSCAGLTRLGNPATCCCRLKPI